MYGHLLIIITTVLELGKSENKKDCLKENWNKKQITRKTKDNRLDENIDKGQKALEKVCTREPGFLLRRLLKQNGSKKKKKVS